MRTRSHMLEPITDEKAIVWNGTLEFDSRTAIEE